MTIFCAVHETVTGASSALALKAIKISVNANANHQLVLTEAVGNVQRIREAEVNDSPGSISITGVSFTSTGAATSGVTTPAIPGVTVQYTVSGTDGYYASGSLQTNAAGRVSFSIPPGASGVVDTISLTAVLSGIAARTTYTW